MGEHEHPSATLLIPNTIPSEEFVTPHPHWDGEKPPLILPFCPALIRPCQWGCSGPNNPFDPRPFIPDSALWPLHSPWKSQHGKQLLPSDQSQCRDSHWENGKISDKEPLKPVGDLEFPEGRGGGPCLSPLCQHIFSSHQFSHLGSIHGLEVQTDPPSPWLCQLKKQWEE